MRGLKTILAATNGSEEGGWAVASGAALAQRAGATLSVVSVVDETALPGLYGLNSKEIADYQRTLLAEVRRRAAAQIEQAEAHGAELTVGSGVPASLIVKAADEVGADLILLGAQHRSAFARLLAGSTAERVIRLARCPVLTTTALMREPLQRVLAAIDLSPQSNPVLETAATLAALDGAKLRVLYVSEPLDAMMRSLALFDDKVMHRGARSQLERFVNGLAQRAGLAVESEIRDGRAGQEILKEAEVWDADITAIGTHGFGFFERLLLGSTTTDVLRLGRRPTIIVPRID
jgi:nucleotide-binding universal stress UspA family protein